MKNVVLKNTVVVGGGGRLTSKSVQGTSGLLQCEHDVKGGHGFAVAVLGVSDGVTDQALKKELQDGASLLVDGARDALNTSTAC